MDISASSISNHVFHSIQPASATACTNPVPSSSPAFSTPVHPVHPAKVAESSQPLIIPIQLPSATLRPLAFRTFTKKYNLTLTTSALHSLADLIGVNCGSAWRENGSAERVLEDVAKAWKKNGGGVIVPGEGEDIWKILREVESSMAEDTIKLPKSLSRLGSFVFGAHNNLKVGEEVSQVSSNEGCQNSLIKPALDVDDNDDGDGDQSNDLRSWIQIVDAFQQPRLTYNWTLKHFEVIGTPASLLPDPSRKTVFFRHRYNLIHQRLLRNESFQVSTVTTSKISNIQQSSSNLASAHQAYTLTPIANLLGRSGTRHLILGILTVSPTGRLTASDLSGSIALELQHTRSIPEGGAWFTPGMVVLIDGIYEDEGSTAGAVFGGDSGIGGTIGGKFIGFSVGGPPCERREITLGLSSGDAKGDKSSGAGFGWVDFLGVGSERATGARMRKLEQKVMNLTTTKVSNEERGRIVIMGEVDLTSPNTLLALRKVLGMYAAKPSEQAPVMFVLMGNFVQYAVMAGGGSGGSIDYKEYFDSLALVLADYPAVLQNAKFLFVPGDNDPWASAFSAGAATILPRASIPEIFTTRIKRAFTMAKTKAEISVSGKANGDAIWSTNPARVTLFGTAQELVFFRDDITGRLRRNALKFETQNQQGGLDFDPVISQTRQSSPLSKSKKCESQNTKPAIEEAKPCIPVPKPTHLTDPAVPSDLSNARKLVKTVLDQGYLSPFPLHIRPVLWDYAGALQLYPLPSALVLMDPDASGFAVTYEGCHVMNPGTLVVHARKGIAQWIEYNARTRRGRLKETRF